MTRDSTSGLQGRSREVAKAWLKPRNEGACRWDRLFRFRVQVLVLFRAVCWTRVSTSTAGHTMAARINRKQMLSCRDKLRVFLSNDIPDVHLGGLFRVAPVPAIAGKAARMSRGTNHRMCLVHCVCRESRKGGDTWAAGISTIPFVPIKSRDPFKISVVRCCSASSVDARRKGPSSRSTCRGVCSTATSASQGWKSTAADWWLGAGLTSNFFSHGCWTGMLGVVWMPCMQAMVVDLGLAENGRSACIRVCGVRGCVHEGPVPLAACLRDDGRLSPRYPASRVCVEEKGFSRSSA